MSKFMLNELSGCLVLCSGLLLMGCGRQAGSSNSTNSPVAAAPSTGTVWFEDLTARTGLSFQHVAGTDYSMPDQMGGGGAFLDYDNDGRLDLYLVQTGGLNRRATNQLFHQEANGTFRDVSAGSGLDVTGRGMGAIAGDLNNDGRADVIVTEYGAVRCFMNVGVGHFQELTREAGLDNPRWAVPASLLDFDRDGWLDLVVGNYVDFDPTRVCSDVQGRQDFCGPKQFGDTTTRLWRNVTGTPGGPVRFEDYTERSKLSRVAGAALGLLCADLDGDGWPDIFCADDQRPNRVFMNQRDGTFREEAVPRGLAFTAMGTVAANMGVAWADIDGDGLGDLFTTHLSDEFHSLFVQGPRGLFSDRTGTSGLQQQAWRGTGWGTVLVDFDDDGSPDLAFLNGMVRRMAPAQTPILLGVDEWWGRYAQKPQLFANIGAGKFRDISLANSALCGPAFNGRGLLVGDVDADGAMDLVLCGVGGPVRLLRNVASRRGHWLGLRVIDPQRGGRDAIGAEVRVVTGQRTRFALAQPATSYLASHDPTLHFGLGAETSVQNIQVLWPDGQRETFPGGAVDRAQVLRKGSGQADAK